VNDLGSNNIPGLSSVAKIIFIKPLLWMWRKRLTILSVVIIIVAIHGAATVIMGRKVQARLQEIRAAGDPVYPIDLQQKPVPDSENGAIDLEKIFRPISPLALFVDKGLPSSRSRIWEHDRKWWATVKTMLKKVDKPLLQVAPALAKPHVQFEIKWKAGFTTLVPHYYKIRKLSRVLCIKARCEARAGNTQQAINWVMLAIDLSDAFQQEKSVPSQLTRIAVIRIALSALEDIARHCRITPKMQKQIDVGLSRIELNQSFVNAVKGERALLTPAFISVECINIDDVMPTFPYSLPLRPFLYADELCYLNETERRIKLLEKPYRDTASQFKQMEAEISSLPKYCWISSFLLSNVDSSVSRRDMVVSSINGMKIIYKLASYHSVHGVYPDKLSDLGVDIPKDVMTGKPYIYKMQGRGFLLHGLGPSLIDHGGKDYRDTQPAYPEQGDISWKFDN